MEHELVAVKKLRDEKYNSAMMTIYYENGEKKISIDDAPTIRFRTTKLDCAEKYKDKFLVTIPTEDTEEVEVPCNETYDEIVRLQRDFDPEAAERNFAYLDSCRRNRVNPQNLLLLNHTHGIDVDITDHYIGRFLDTHKDSIVSKNIKKGYFDIETNNRIARRFIPAEEASSPVNAISFFDASTSTLVLRFLDDEGKEEHYLEKNPLITAFKSDLENNRLKIEALANEEQKKVFPDAVLPRINVVIKFYSDEIELIKEHYEDLRNVYKIDYLMAWNQEFDINFTFQRVRRQTSYERLTDMVSDPSVPVGLRSAYYRGDFKARDISKKNDIYSISSPWHCLDLQYVYFKIRESMKKPEENNLDWALQKELKIKKVEHESEMSDFPYADFFQFAWYSAKDSLGLYWLDRQTCDVDTFIMLGVMSHTRPEKCMTKTTMLRNFLECFYRDIKGVTLSNNRVKINNSLRKNAEEAGKVYDLYPELTFFLKNDPEAVALSKLEDEDDDDNEEDIDADDLEDEEIESAVKQVAGKKVKFRGAFVASPLLMENVGVNILGRASSLIFDMVADEDLSSLYPNLKIAWNIYVDTMVGKIYRKSNVLDINFSAELADYVVSRDSVMLGKRYFGLPDYKELAEMFISEAV